MFDRERGEITPITIYGGASSQGDLDARQFLVVSVSPPKIAARRAKGTSTPVNSKLFQSHRHKQRSQSAPYFKEAWLCCPRAKPKKQPRLVEHISRAVY